MRQTLKLLVVVSVLITACKKNDVISRQEVDFDSSYQKFVAFKSTNSNSYVYTATTTSFSGFSTKTIITVANGKVVSRSFKQFDGLPNGMQGPLRNSWDEDTSNLGSHKEGSEALTLDQVYDKAKNVWLKADLKTNDIYFSADINGLIMNCGYVPKGCQDDCFTGIKITSIVSLKN